MIVVLITLCLFGFKLDLFSYFQVIFLIKSSVAEWITALGTLMAVVVSLLIAIGGNKLRHLVEKPDIQLKNSLKNIQPDKAKGIEQGHTRLLFFNEGNATAKGVEIYVTSIKPNGKKREHFLPVPLSWTHDGKSRRDFHPNQFGYLDLCRIENINDTSSNPKLVLAAGGGVSTYEQIDHGENELELVIFQESGENKYYHLRLAWKRGDKNVEVVDFNEIPTRKNERYKRQCMKK